MEDQNQVPPPATPESYNNQPPTGPQVFTPGGQPPQTPSPAQPNPVPQPGAGLQPPRPGPEKIPTFSRRRLAIIMGIVLILIGGGLAAYWYLHKPSPSNPVDRFGVEVTPFSLISSTPAKGQTDISPNSKITLDFNQPVNPDNLQGNFFVKPSVNGKFSQGKTNNEAIFTPDVPFASGAEINLMLNGSFQSNSGSQLGADYNFGFTTSLPADSVAFQNKANSIFSNVAPAVSDQKQNFQVLLGSNLKNVDVTIYKSDMQSLLSSLAYKTGRGGYAAYQTTSVNTSALTQVGRFAKLSNQQGFNITQGSGVYLAVATSGDKQSGHLWVVYSKIGALLRQDDQKVVVAAQAIGSGSDVSGYAAFYALNGGLNHVATIPIKGLTTKNWPYSQKLDAVIINSGNEQAFVPVGLPSSLAGIRANQNLSNSNMIFGTTDKPVYQPGEQVQFAGFSRTDNDAQYTLPGTGQLNLYAAADPYSRHLADFNVSVNADGTFNGAVPTSSVWLSKSDISAGSNVPFHIYAKSVSPKNTYNHDIVVANFMLTAAKTATSDLNVNFNKASYLPTDQIAGTIKGASVNGQPLAGATVTVHVYSKDYSETSQYANQTVAGYLGGEIKDSPFNVTLDAGGSGSFSVKTANLPADGSSQTVTAQASYQDTNGAVAAGAGSAVAHQGDGVLVFGPSRNLIAPGGQLVSRVYATRLDGSPMANATINYQFLSDDTSTGQLVKKPINSGSVIADANGYAQITLPYPSSSKDAQTTELDVSTGDANSDKISAANYYYGADPNGLFDDSGTMLSDLDISGSRNPVKVGDYLNLTVNAPQALNAMLTMGRGRIYNAKMMKLQAGNNSLNVNVTQNLAPSFTLVFSYFKNGVYHSEGYQFNVGEPAQKASVKLTPASSSTSAGSDERVSVSVTDSSGNYLASNLIVSVVDANGYNLSSQAAPDMYTLFFAPRVLTTNSTSSLTGIGSGGNADRGGNGGLSIDFTNLPGKTILWNPSLSSDASGQAHFDFSPPKGTWRVTVYSMSAGSIVGSATTTVTAN